MNSLPQLRRRARFNVYSIESDPFRLVEAAQTLKTSGQLEPGDQVWCIFDAEYPEPHGKLKEAVKLAKANDVQMAVSNPAFEVWLLLHDQKISRHSTSSDIKREFRGQPDPSKVDFYFPRLSTAVSNARALAEKHKTDGKDFPDDNPSSDVFKVFVQLEKYMAT